jgi:Rha family phage regulatory protein
MINAVLEIKNESNYSSLAAAKSAAGRGNPMFTRAHNRASGFFMRQAQPQLHSMVGRAGQPKGWPDSRVTGISTPVRLTTRKRGNFGGELSNLSHEAVVMTTIPAFLHPEVTVANGRAVTTTIAVASFFRKEHKDVLRKISALDCSPAFTKRNFTLSEYTDTTGRTLPMYEMTKDGFVFLVIGFTGKRAAAFKEAYISEFNRLESELTRQLTAAAPAMPVFPVDSDFMYLTTVEHGHVVNIQMARPGQMLLSYGDFVDIAQRTGCVVIGEAELRSLSSEEIIALCENARASLAKWGKLHAR